MLWTSHFESVRQLKTETTPAWLNSVVRFQEYCHQQSINVKVVTDSTDGHLATLMRKSPILGATMSDNKTKGLYELNGNVHYMKCFNPKCAARSEATPLPDFYNTPKKKDQLICGTCDTPMRPNVDA